MARSSAGKVAGGKREHFIFRVYVCNTFIYLWYMILGTYEEIYGVSFRGCMWHKECRIITFAIAIIDE